MPREILPPITIASRLAAVVRAEMEEAIASFRAAGDPLAEHYAIALEAHDLRIAPGRMGEMDRGGRLILLYGVAELHQGLEEAALARIDEVIGTADLHEPGAQRGLDPEVADHLQMLEQPTHAGLRDLERGGRHRAGTAGLGADGGDAVAVR